MMKVGKFMSLAKKASSANKNDVVETTNEKALKNIVLAQSVPATGKLFAPKIIYKSMPDYPIKAIEDGIQGSVIIKVYILKNGRVGQALIEQTSGHEILDKSAISAVSQWIFEPAIYYKESTESWFKIPVRFQIKI